jgi:putative oxidoreductase
MPEGDAMNPSTLNSVALVGRILLAAMFVLSGWGKIGGFSGTAGYIASHGLPFAELLTALTIALELGGGILLIVGYKARWVALLFFLWLIPTTFIFHRFWGIDPAQAQGQMINFEKNVSIMGAMLLVFAFGPGAYSVDGRREL